MCHFDFPSIMKKSPYTGDYKLFNPIRNEKFPIRLKNFSCLNLREVFIIRKIIFNIISNIAPGIPKNPTISEVKKFNPIWKLKLAPIKLIIYIKIAPNIELSINLKMLFIGQINILPNMNISIIQVKNVIIEFISKIITSK